MIDPASKGLTKIVSPSPLTAKIKVQETFLFDNVGGPVKLEVKTEYYGSEADNQRSYFSTSSLKDIEKSYLNFYAATFPEIEVARDFEFLDFESENKFTTLEEYTIENLWEAQEDNENILQASFYPQILRDYIKQPRTSKRTTPMDLGYPLDVEHEVLLYLPEYWPLKEVTKEVSDKNFMYASHIAYDSRSNLATLNYTYTTLHDHVMPEDMASFKKNQKLMLDDLGYSLTYDKAMAGAGGADFEFSWWILLFGLLVAGAAALGAYKLYHYDPLPAPGYIAGDGIAVGGWLILPLLGIISTPFRTLILIGSNGYFNQTVWVNLLSPALSTFNPALAGAMLGELIINIGFLVYSLLVAILFLQKRSSVPRLMVVLYISNLLFLIADYVALEVLELSSGAENSLASIASAFIVAAIWVPYFNVSTRVKETFVVQLNPAEPDEVLLEERALTGTGI